MGPAPWILRWSDQAVLRGNQAHEASLTLSANNIFDVDARRHASFLKD
jgi:hypothetical protein